MEPSALYNSLFSYTLYALLESNNNFVLCMLCQRATRVPLVVLYEDATWRPGTEIGYPITKLPKSSEKALRGFLLR